MLERVNRLAKGAKTEGDTRSLDQISADVFSDLVTGRGLSAAPAGSVDITVDLATLTGLSEVPGEIPGWGPVIADIARQVALANEGGEWRVSVTDPETGQVAWNGTTRRRPSATERRYVLARRPVCVFPGCRMPARAATSTTPSTTPRGDAPIPTTSDPLPPPPPPEARSWLETRTTRAGLFHLDESARAHIPRRPRAMR